MEQGIENSDFVIVICTPTYAERANSRDGGVGYESMVITSAFASRFRTPKFIPVLRQIAQKIRDDKLPCDAVIYLGTGYCTNGWNLGHGSLAFNPNAFPNPAQQLKALHDLHLKVVLHINAAPRNLLALP